MTDLEIGAFCLAMRIKGETPDEMCGFLEPPWTQRTVLEPPHGRRPPVVLPSYNGARRMPDLTPLLALLLARDGVPVLVHGLLEGFGRVTSGHVFRELGIMPAATASQAQACLQETGLAFVPLSTLCPGLHQLLGLRSRLGVRNSAHSLVKLIDPFSNQAVLVAAATHPEFIDLMRGMLLDQGRRAILLRGTEGEPFANPKRRPRLEYLDGGVGEVLFEAEHDSLRALPNLPDGADAATTAKWTRRVLDNHLPLPLPIANQLACCLYASGYAEDFNQAKAIVAVEANGLAVAPN